MQDLCHHPTTRRWGKANVGHRYDDRSSTVAYEPIGAGLGWVNVSPGKGFVAIPTWNPESLEQSISIIPVGKGAPSVVVSGPGLPELVSVPSPQPPSDIFGPIDRRDTPSFTPPQTLLPRGGGVKQAKDWFEYWDLVNQGIPVQQPSITRVIDTGVQPVPTVQTPILEDTTGDADMAGIDWGGVYEIIDTTVGGILPGGVPFGSSWPQLGMGPQLMPILPVNTGGGSALPPITPVVSLGNGASCPIIPPGYYMNKFGCLVKRKKKRRKQLLTQADAAQLSHLLSIAGKNSEVSKAWIATHS